MNPNAAEPTWITAVKARGLGHILSLALDVLEPLGPLGAQVVWAAQPVLGLWVERAALGAVAQALEEPGGVAHLREQLDEHS
jgi:hypothetical protein